jgi:hypothetical protein
MAQVEDHTAEEQARGQAYEFTWETGQRMLADPHVRVRVLQALAALDTRPPAPRVTPEQLQELVEDHLAHRRGAA